MSTANRKYKGSVFVDLFSELPIVHKTIIN